jgi:hypothetical protein
MQMSFMVGYMQLVFWTEDFGTGCGTGTPANGYGTPNGTWTVVNTGTNDIYANIWYVSAEENGNGAGNCGSGCGTNRTLHVSSDPNISGDVGAAYYSGDGGWFGMPSTTNKRVQSPVINCSGRSNITLSFVYMEYGQGTTDNATLWYYDGSTWSQLVDLPKTTCCGGPCNGSRQGKWSSYSITLPASANNNPNVRIGFRWVNNNDMDGYDPSFAVDDITLSVPNPVPIELMDFYGFCDRNQVHLAWETATEINNQYFELQYSFDGSKFYPALQINGAINSADIRHYECTDVIRGDEVYYRLKQVNMDGTFSFFSPIVISCDLKNNSPQAFLKKNQLHIINLDENFLSNLEIFSMDGKLIYATQTKGEIVIPLEVHEFILVRIETPYNIIVMKPKIVAL